MIVVDTNIWSELTKRHPDPAVVRWERENAGLLWLSVVVLAEFRAGAALMADGRKRSIIEAMIEQVAAQCADRLLVFDDRCAREYGAVLRSARGAGRPIMTADAMIAATARAHGMSVATRDVNDFAGAGVALINPWQA